MLVLLCTPPPTTPACLPACRHSQQPAAAISVGTHVCATHRAPNHAHLPVPAGIHSNLPPPVRIGACRALVTLLPSIGQHAAAVAAVSSQAVPLEAQQQGPAMPPVAVSGTGSSEAKVAAAAAKLVGASESGAGAAGVLALGRLGSFLL